MPYTFPFTHFHFDPASLEAMIRKEVMDPSRETSYFNTAMFFFRFDRKRFQPTDLKEGPISFQFQHGDFYSEISAPWISAAPP